MPWVLWITSACMVVARDEAGNLIEEYSGMLADLGPKLVADFPDLAITTGKLIDRGKIISEKPTRTSS